MPRKKRVPIITDEDIRILSSEINALYYKNSVAGLCMGRACMNKVPWKGRMLCDPCRDAWRDEKPKVDWEGA